MGNRIKIECFRTTAASQRQQWQRCYKYRMHFVSHSARMLLCCSVCQYTYSVFNNKCILCNAMHTSILSVFTKRATKRLFWSDSFARSKPSHKSLWESQRWIRASAKSNPSAQDYWGHTTDRMCVFIFPYKTQSWGSSFFTILNGCM